MSDAAQLPQPMDADTFLEWCTHQEERYELIDGRPVLKNEDWVTIDGPPVLMTGARHRHDDVVVNLLTALRNRLRGSSCRPSTADVASRMSRGNIRRPDVTVDCGRDPDSLSSTEPTVFFEVLSPTTRGADLVRKADEYRRLTSLKAFIIVEPDRPTVSLSARGDDGLWDERELFTSLEDVLELPAIGVELPLTEIYDGVDLRRG